MLDDPPVRMPELYPGVYLLALPGTEDAVLVDRARAVPAWVAVADVVVDSRPGEDPRRLVRLAALAHQLRLAAVSRRSARSPGSA